MTRIHVSPLSQVERTLARSGAASVISVLALRHHVPDFSTIAPNRRLHLPVSDIVVATEAYLLAETGHIDDLLGFVRAWDRQSGLLIHCYAGVSRSTAAAFIALCALDPATSEAVHASRLREASPTATPNPRLVALADTVLGREGRMTAATRAIGRGADCCEGMPFALDVPPPSRPGAPPVELG